MRDLKGQDHERKKVRKKGYEPVAIKSSMMMTLSPSLMAPDWISNES